ncbi:hypothetical protein Poli38472_010004 [Pythium oligandrum]|uniref:Uncharacterized protein n=1 Tax=Pythium oligandrum TaxID=41045 RepID=A0A8K1C8W8_PYTOL|nr:hypothetical protein Poli38472_010004 [Pythium oligandrum]|eukprot:TMW58445.1 hypothetical protein Poli38472_010004 [Pythium oligandrum]
MVFKRIAIAVAVCCGVISSTAVVATTPQNDLVLTGSPLEDDLRRIQTEYSSIYPLTDAVLSSTSSPATRREALVELGDIFFYGNNTVAASVNGTLALSFFEKAAELGDPRAQFHLGVAYSYGFWGFQRDEAMAMTQYYFSSLGQHMGAVMALGHRHLLGIHAPKNCESAVRYYEVAANKAMELREANLSQPAIYDLPYRRLKNVHETQHKKNIPSDSAIVDYYQFSADKGDPEATINLATLHFYGARGLSQDVIRAAELFQKAYDLGASGSAYNLGHLYNHGIGVKQDNATAFKYLQEASEEGNMAAQNELAYMYLHGKGTTRNHEKALSLFKAAAKQGSTEAFYNLGVLHLQGAGSVKSRDPEYEVAHGYFQVAAHQGHTLSSHKLAHMSLHGIGTSRSCKNAVDSFKHVAERGEWDRMMARAFKDFKNQDYEAAFMKYAVMAQQGYEVAQHNAAYLLDYGFLTSLIPSAVVVSSSLSSDEMTHGAIQLYKLAAIQGNVDANLKIGDFYYYGRGDHAVDYAKASAHYSLASKRANAQAMFNLGLMYEHGVGVQQDFHLAKRFFDKAIEAHSDARVPATLALWKLKTHMWVVSWKRWWDELVGNVPPSTPATMSPPEPEVDDSDAGFGDAFASRVASLLTKWFSLDGSEGDDTVETVEPMAEPRVGTGSDIAWASGVSDFVFSDDFLILVLALALGAVLYIRSERQNRLDAEAREPLQAPAQ